MLLSPKAIGVSIKRCRKLVSSRGRRTRGPTNALVFGTGELVVTYDNGDKLLSRTCWRSPEWLWRYRSSFSKIRGMIERSAESLSSFAVFHQFLNLPGELKKSFCPEGVSLSASSFLENKRVSTKLVNEILRPQSRNRHARDLSKSMCCLQCLLFMPLLMSRSIRATNGYLTECLRHPRWTCVSTPASHVLPPARPGSGRSTPYLPPWLNHPDWRRRVEHRHPRRALRVQWYQRRSTTFGSRFNNRSTHIFGKTRKSLLYAPSSFSISFRLPINTIVPDTILTAPRQPASERDSDIFSITVADRVPPQIPSICPDELEYSTKSSPPTSSPTSKSHAS
jgi:hypothetical protein